jgi:hypothetical protein
VKLHHVAFAAFWANAFNPHLFTVFAKIRLTIFPQFQDFIYFHGQRLYGLENR